MTDEEKAAGLRIRYDYANENHFDELCRYFPEYTQRHVRIPLNPLWPVSNPVLWKMTTTACEVHHISGGILGTPRHDIVTNLIHLHWTTHRWCERYTADGFALCMAAKLFKGEWDEGTMNRIMHVDSSLGWIMSTELRFDWVWGVLQKAIDFRENQTRQRAEGEVA